MPVGGGALDAPCQRGETDMRGVEGAAPYGFLFDSSALPPYAGSRMTPMKKGSLVSISTSI